MWECRSSYLLRGSPDSRYFINSTRQNDSRKYIALQTVAPGPTSLNVRNVLTNLQSPLTVEAPFALRSAGKLAKRKFVCLNSRLTLRWRSSDAWLILSFTYPLRWWPSLTTLNVFVPYIAWSTSPITIPLGSGDYLSAGSGQWPRSRCLWYRSRFACGIVNVSHCQWYCLLYILAKNGHVCSCSPILQPQSRVFLKIWSLGPPDEVLYCLLCQAHHVE